MATKTMSKDQILEAIDGMTVLELSELVKAFEERLPRSRPSSTRC
jgi:ribosomal protein L7/L12